MKIVTIGAGSSYTPELAEGLIKRYESIPLTEWWLVDVEEGRDKLDIIYNLVNRMFRAKKLPVKIFKTLNRREALKDADYITTQLRVGQLAARRKDEYIPLKYGMIGQETNGAGGMFKGLRTIPVILDIVKDVQELSKSSAWIINFTNPAGMVAEAINSLTNFKKFIGVCNVPIHTRMDVAKLLDTTIEHIKADVVGLNHLSYFTKFYLDNNDVTEKVLSEVKNPEKSKKMSMRNISNIAWEEKFIEDLNVLPSPYHRYYYKTGTILKEYEALAKDHKVRAQVVSEIEKKLFEKYKDPNLNVKPPELEERGGAYYSDVAAGVLKSLITNDSKEFAVNTINGDKVANLPNDWTVEVTCKIGKSGPIKVDREILLPKETIGLVTTIKVYERKVIEAVKERSLEKAYLALVINPLSNDDIVARRVFLELVNSHKKYLTYYDDLNTLLEEYEK